MGFMDILETVGRVAGGVATGGLSELGIAAVNAAKDGDLFSTGKYDAQGNATYGGSDMTPEEYASTQAEKDKYEALYNQTGSDMARDRLEELNGQLAKQSFAGKEAARMAGLARTDRATGEGFARDFRNASNLDLGGFQSQSNAATTNIDNSEALVNNQMRARALGGYAGSPEQQAAAAQGEDARRALASAMASRGGAFRGAGVTANATVDAQRDANRAGILAAGANQDQRMAAYNQAMGQNAAARMGMANQQMTAAQAVTDRRLAGLQGAAGSQLGFNKSAQGNESLGQSGYLANQEALESANRRKDAAAQNAANAPTATEKIIDIGMKVAPMVAGGGGGSDKRMKWGAKRQQTKIKKSGLDNLLERTGMGGY